jgi:DNA-binding transcriptional regulator YiaG
MRKTWTQIKNETMSKRDQRRARQLALEDVREMELAELREALKIRQEDLAEKLKVTQATISRLERRPNVLLGSLANYIDGLGGRLELRAVLPNRTVRLTQVFLNPGRKKPARGVMARGKRGRRAARAITR